MAMAMASAVAYFWRQQQPPPSVILVVLIAGFAALLPAGSVAQPQALDAEAKAVVDQLMRSGACTRSLPITSDPGFCVTEFRAGRGGICCLHLATDCLCALREKQDVLGIPREKLCVNSRRDDDCARIAEAAKAAQQREEELSKLSPCERILKRLEAGEQSKLTPADGTACVQQVAAGCNDNAAGTHK